MRHIYNITKPKSKDNIDTLYCRILYLFSEQILNFALNSECAALRNQVSLTLAFNVLACSQSTIYFPYGVHSILLILRLLVLMISWHGLVSAVYYPITLQSSISPCLWQNYLSSGGELYVKRDRRTGVRALAIERASW
jgi:hypothetical protein